MSRKENVPAKPIKVLCTFFFSYILQPLFTMSLLFPDPVYVDDLRRVSRHVLYRSNVVEVNDMAGSWMKRSIWKFIGAKVFNQQRT